MLFFHKKKAFVSPPPSAGETEKGFMEDLYKELLP